MESQNKNEKLEYSVTIIKFLPVARTTLGLIALMLVLQKVSKSVFLAGS